MVFSTDTISFYMARSHTTGTGHRPGYYRPYKHVDNDKVTVIRDRHFRSVHVSIVCRGLVSYVLDDATQLMQGVFAEWEKHHLLSKKEHTIGWRPCEWEKYHLSFHQRKSKNRGCCMFFVWWKELFLSFSETCPASAAWRHPIRQWVANDFLYRQSLFVRFWISNE